MRTFQLVIRGILLLMVWNVGAQTLTRSSEAQTAAVALVTVHQVPFLVNGTTGKSLTRLSIRDSLRVIRDGRVLIFFPASGTEFELLGAGDYRVLVDRIESTTEQNVTSIRTTARAAQFKQIKLDSRNLLQAGVQMRSFAQSSAPTQSTLLLVEPTKIYWKPDPDAFVHRVEIRDNQGNIAFSSIVQGAEYSLSPALSLAGGEAHEWRVVAVLPAETKTLQSGKLVIPPLETREQIAKLQVSAREDPGMEVLLNVWLEQLRSGEVELAKSPR
jgi:hypothetical protein